MREALAARATVGEVCGELRAAWGTYDALLGAALMGFRPVELEHLEWITRPHEPGEPARHVAELSDVAGFAHTRANAWVYEPGAGGPPPPASDAGGDVRRARGHALDVPRRAAGAPGHEPGGLIHVDAGTPLQTVNHGDVDLLVYVYGYPPEDEHAELLDSAV